MFIKGRLSKQMDNADINTIFYEGEQKNLAAIRSDEVFHMALVQMKTRKDHVDQVFEFIVNRKGKTKSLVMIILEH